MFLQFLARNLDCRRSLIAVKKTQRQFTKWFLVCIILFLGLIYVWVMIRFLTVLRIYVCSTFLLIQIECQFFGTDWLSVLDLPRAGHCLGTYF